MIIGYARVSTEEQHLDAQISALEATGAERIFSEKVSGTKRTRPELSRMIEQLRDGDVVVVTKYDRLSRSLQDLLSIVEAIRDQGAGFRSLAEDIDTTTPAGRLVFHVFGFVPTKVPNPPQGFFIDLISLRFLWFRHPRSAPYIIELISGGVLWLKICCCTYGKVRSQNDRFPCSLSQELNLLIS